MSFLLIRFVLKGFKLEGRAKVVCFPPDVSQFGEIFV